MKNRILSASPEMKTEYCAQVIKIGELKLKKIMKNKIIVNVF